MKNLFVSRGTSILDVIELLSLMGIIASIFFPVRYVLENNQANILGYYSDFTSISLYISFICILIFIGINIYRQIINKSVKGISIILLSTFALLIIYQSQLNLEAMTSFYYTLRISCALLLGYLVYKSPTPLKYKTIILWICVLLGATQGLIALIQFLTQQSIGLHILGESPLAVTMYGVAKVVSRGTTYIRGYGTSPHPNILAGILSIISLLNLYLLNNTSQLKQRIILNLFYTLMVIGLVTTLSRGGIAAFIISTIAWIVLNTYRKKSILFMRKLWLVPIVIILFASLFSPWIVSRGTLSGESSTFRQLYNYEGVKIIENNWLIGSGPGTNLFQMTESLKDRLEYWDIQPIHNFWLITWSELGIIGLIITFFILKGLGESLFRPFSRENATSTGKINCWSVTLAAISISIIGLSLLDHYFYTIWPAQLLLAIMIGLMYKEFSPRGE